MFQSYKNNGDNEPIGKKAYLYLSFLPHQIHAFGADKSKSVKDLDRETD